MKVITVTSMIATTLLLKVCLWSVLLAVLAGCGHAALTEPAILPSGVMCKLFWRASDTLSRGDSDSDPKFQLQERAIHVERGKESDFRLADAAIKVSYRSDAHEGSNVIVQVSFDDKPMVRWLYQLSSSPKNQFVGGHGFTGLVYLRHPTKRSDDYQFMCEFVN